MPVGPHRRDLPDQIDVEALVNDAEEADARMRDGRLVGGIALGLPRAREVLDVDAARERIHLRVQVALRLVEALAACQHDIGALHQLGFSLPEGGGRAGEC